MISHFQDIEKKMVSGSVRLHLLMAEEASLPDDQNGDEHKDDPDYRVLARLAMSPKRLAQRDFVCCGESFWWSFD